MKVQLSIKLIVFMCFTFYFTSLSSQNLLDTSTWTIGSGSVGEFTQNGVTEENTRVLYPNHLGNEVIVWKGTPLANSSNASGGWYTNFHTIDNSKTYRISVWIKKTNSNVGRTYFGCSSSYGGGSRILNLDGTTNGNPYFWSGDLPQLDTWYLLVGYVNPVGFNGNSIGGIYDNSTQQKVVDGIDFKFSSSAVNLRQKAYLYWTNNENDIQYFYAPRIDEINGNEPTLSQLFLQVNENSIIKLAYDTAGNQIERQYCADGTCPTRVSEEIKQKEEVVQDIETGDLLEDISTSLTIYPNPTKGIVNIQTKDDSIKAVHVFDIKGSLLNSINYNVSNPKVEVDLSQYPIGVYYLHLHFKNGDSTTKKIIKH